MLDVSTIVLSGIICLSITKASAVHNPASSKRVLGYVQPPQRHHGHTVEENDAPLKKTIERTSGKGLHLNGERCVFRISKLTFMFYLLSKRGLGTTEPLITTSHLEVDFHVLPIVQKRTWDN